MNTTEQTTQIKASHDQIAALAYQLWEKDGKVSGHDQEYWFRAEKQLRADCGLTVAKATIPKSNSNPASQVHTSRANHPNRGSHSPQRTSLAKG